MDRCNHKNFVGSVVLAEVCMRSPTAMIFSTRLRHLKLMYVFSCFFVFLYFFTLLPYAGEMRLYTKVIKIALQTFTLSDPVYPENWKWLRRIRRVIQIGDPAWSFRRFTVNPTCDADRRTAESILLSAKRRSDSSRTREDWQTDRCRKYRARGDGRVHGSAWHIHSCQTARWGTIVTAGDREATGGELTARQPLGA